MHGRVKQSQSNQELETQRIQLKLLGSQGFRMVALGNNQAEFRVRIPTKMTKTRILIRKTKKMNTGQKTSKITKKIKMKMQMMSMGRKEAKRQLTKMRMKEMLKMSSKMVKRRKNIDL